MRLRLIRYPPASEAGQRRRPLGSWELTASATLGSGPEATLPVPDLPPLAGDLHRGDDGHWTLTPRCAGWQHAGQELREPLRLRNGERLWLGQEEWLVAFLFAPAERHRRTQWLPLLAALLVAVVLIMELALVAWLPMRAAQVATDSIELLRQQSIRLLDGQRARVAVLRERAAEQPREQAWLALIGQELDQVAEYLRRHGETLRGDELRRLHEELLAWSELLKAQSAGDLLPPPTALEPAQTLQRWLPAPKTP